MLSEHSIWLIVFAGLQERASCSFAASNQCHQRTNERSHPGMISELRRRNDCSRRSLGVKIDSHKGVGTGPRAASIFGGNYRRASKIATQHASLRRLSSSMSISSSSSSIEREKEKGEKVFSCQTTVMASTSDLGYVIMEISEEFGGIMKYLLIFRRAGDNVRNKRTPCVDKQCLQA